MRLEVSSHKVPIILKCVSGVAFVFLSQGKCKGCLTRCAWAPPCPETACLQLEIGNIRCEIGLFLFCFPAILFGSLCHSMGCFPTGNLWDPGMRSLGFHSSVSVGKGEHDSVHLKLRAGGLLSYQLRLSLNLFPQWRADLVRCAHRLEETNRPRTNFC